jgi:hypothetical protein
LSLRLVNCFLLFCWWRLLGPNRHLQWRRHGGGMIPPSEIDINRRQMMECDFFPKSSGPHEESDYETINTSLTYTYQAVACSEVQTNKNNQDGDGACRKSYSFYG